MVRKYIRKRGRCSYRRIPRTLGSGSTMVHVHTISTGITTDIVGTDGSVALVLI